MIFIFFNIDRAIDMKYLYINHDEIDDIEIIERRIDQYPR